MNHNREHDKIRDEFFKNYRGRYTSYWIERWGLIPELPTSFDNANSIYELLAWLQRAFKQLLDDFVALEAEFEDFKNAITELLEYLIPELIRRFANSVEFRNLFKNLLKDILESDLRDWFKKYLKEILKDPELKEFFKEYLKELLSDPQLKEYFKEYLKDLLNDPQFLKDIEDKLGITDLKKENERLKKALTKIINNLQNSGAWSGGLDGNMNSGRNIATGNINIFGGTVDGSSFIRTNSGQTENDLAGGI